MARLKTNQPLSRPPLNVTSCRTLTCGALLLVTLLGQPFTQRSCLWAEDQPSGSSIADGAVDEETLAKDASTEINVKNADLTAIVRIFSKKTRRNFILDERVKGKVSIYLPGKVSAEESLRILDSVLAYKGFASVPIGPNLWKIVPAKEARTSTIPTQTTRPDGTPGPEIVTRLVQLKFIGADDVRQILQQLISSDGFISAYPSTNSLILIDSEDNIERLVDIMSTLDVPFSNREMTIIPIVHAEAKDIADKLSEILGIGSSASSGTSQESSPLDFGLEIARARVRQIAMQSAAQGNQGAAPSGAAAISDQPPGTTGTRAIQPKIIPDERTNSIIVVADDDTTARVQALVSQLDSKIDLSGAQFWIYRCQHAKAEDLAEVLSGLTGSGGSRSGSSSGGGLFDTSQDLISGGTRSANRNRTQSRLQSQSRTPGQPRQASGGDRGVASAELGEDISITADPATNSLIIHASKADYEKVKRLLLDIDIKRRQVLVEAMLLEVGIDDSRTTDVSWLTSAGGADGGVIAGNNASNIASLLSNPTGVQDFAVAAASAGSLTIGGGDSQITLPTQSILLNAVRSNSNVNVLSAPTVLTTDNEQAEIVVGSNVPFVTSTATNSENLNNTFNQVERQDVGITLRLTPQISSGDSVTLQIFTEVSSVQSIDPSLGPTTSVRTSETAVITKDGQMIVIGGLMSDEINESERGVPYLKDIPVLGHLFKTSIERRRRTNLLILITPRIIRDQYDARDATLRNRDRVEDAIVFDELYPPRSEVLRSPDIDRVSETNSYDGPLPTTIFEPARAGDGMKTADDTLGAPAASSSAERGRISSDAPPRIDDQALSGLDEVPEFQVAPQFFDSSDPAATDVPSRDTTLKFMPNSGSPAALSPSASRATTRYIVLQIPTDQEFSHGLPFKVSNESGLVGITLPQEFGPEVSSFFSVGRSGNYHTSDRSIPFTTVGAFPSTAEALDMFPDLAISRENSGSGTSTDNSVVTSWYTLSPYEILSLGEGPWR